MRTQGSPGGDGGQAALPSSVLSLDALPTHQQSFMFQTHLNSWDKAEVFVIREGKTFKLSTSCDSPPDPRLRHQRGPPSEGSPAENLEFLTLLSYPLSPTIPGPRPEHPPLPFKESLTLPTALVSPQDASSSSSLDGNGNPWQCASSWYTNGRTGVGEGLWGRGVSVDLRRQPGWV